MRVLQPIAFLLAFVTCASVAHAEEAAEIGEWTVTLPPGFNKISDSCDTSG